MRSLRWTVGSTRRLVILALAVALPFAVVSPAFGATPLPGPTSPAPAPDPIDAYAHYQPQTTCDPTPKPGATYLMHLVLTYYGVGRDVGIGRACSVGGTSEHKEGRALDWGVSVDNPVEKAAADEFTTWLTEDGPDGKPGYNARRLGVMYVIWNRQIWGSYNPGAGWTAYTGAVPHTDHVHVSLSWSGAYMQSSWWTGIAVPSDATIARYITQVYRDLFDRAPDPAGLRTWSTALGNGVPYGAVADAITYSDEYRGRMITDAYRTYLDRAPDPTGFSDWLAAMRVSLHIEDMQAGFISSTEYYALGGGTDRGWITRLYDKVLGRVPADAEVSSWQRRLDTGSSRYEVALGFLYSTEHLTAVVDGYYVELLHRHIDPAGQSTWVHLIQTGYRDEQIIAGIVSSAEYRGNIGTR
ncbi:DUF4214 domain-containing protein [Cellulomonas sp. P24]|uniref:DUF4214 domain-containing protein n=1 Tax=Cellulomonas sp. P24 TaxID=2885206 RepID=UPI00216B2627|nr:DUF4214 domain-containing protein [Cellulomonas sp. P24]MCR6492532.1 DUF4214 domain-containing protein [Cellulomonas sp. P24]